MKLQKSKLTSKKVKVAEGDRDHCTQFRTRKIALPSFWKCV